MNPIWGFVATSGTSVAAKPPQLFLADNLWVKWLFSGSSCVFKFWFGIPCPGCGMTRALWALTRGDFAEAWHWHPLVIMVVLLGVAILFSLRFKRLRPWVFSRRMWWLVLILYLLVYGIRMIMYFPEAEPMTMAPDAIFLRIWRFVQSGFKINMT
jgi:phosphatidylserine synthase